MNTQAEPSVRERAAEPTVESVMALAKTIGMRSSDMMASVCTPTFYVAQGLRNKATDALRAEAEHLVATTQSQRAEIERLRAVLLDARNYIEATTLNTSSAKTRRNYEGCLNRIDAALSGVSHA